MDGMPAETHESALIIARSHLGLCMQTQPHAGECREAGLDTPLRVGLEHGRHSPYAIAFGELAVSGLSSVGNRWEQSSRSIWRSA